MRAQEFVTEISDQRLQHYLQRAVSRVDRRLERMAQARERLNKGYEIYHADRPAGSTQIAHRFEANSPAEAQRYYERYILDYISDIDFDLRLRRSTGIIEEALHFVLPGELRGSYSDQQMLAMGFRRSQNGAWYIDQRRWDQLVSSGKLKESWGPEHYPGILPISDYLGPDSEFVDPTGKRDPTYLLQDVDDLINAGVEPRIVTISPSTVYATQDWLSNDSGDGPLYPEYEDLPVVYIKGDKPYVLDGHHRITAALKQRRPIKVYLFTDQALNQLREFAPDSSGGAQSYYTSTENFVNAYRQQKQEEIEELTDDGWSTDEINDLKQSIANDIYRFQQVQRGFLRGLKPGFDTYLQMDTQLKDQLGCHWINDNLDLNSDWTKIYGRPWGRSDNC